MAKKTKKTKKANNSTPNQPPAKQKKKAMVIREEHPGLVVPLIAWALILLVLGLGDKYEVLDRVFSIWIGGGVTIALFTFAPLYYNKNYLKTPQLKPILTIMVVLMLVGCGALIYFGSWSRPAVFKDQVSMVKPRVSAKLSSGVYALAINGHFKEDKEDAKADAKDDKKKVKKKKSKTKQYRGEYRIALSSSNTGQQVKEFSGKFEHVMKRRKMSKKARGYQEIQKTSDFDTVFVGSGGQYEIRLADISGDLESKIDIAIYKKGVIPYILAVIGVICILLGNFIDHIIRRARIASFIGLSVGGAFGFSAYFYFESSPVMHFKTMAFDVLIGGFVGVMAAYGLYSLLKKYYEKITLSKGLHF